MSPQKQQVTKWIAASNASTGPRTDEGKTRSSQNRISHGLCSKKYLIAPKDRAEFDRHFHEMMEALAPEGAVEIQLAEVIVIDQFRLSRIKNIENEIFAQGAMNAKDDFFAGAETWNARCKEIALLTLYEQRINRILSRNKEEFAARQAERRARPSVPEQLAKVAENTETKAKSPVGPTAPEFVHSPGSCAMPSQPPEASPMPDTRWSDPQKSAPEVLRAA